MVLGSSQEVFRILFNLTHNAVAVARRRQAMSRLEIEVERMDETVAIRMTDDGPGLPKAVRSHLFSRPTGRFSSSSNGFGLAIARELAERNGGTLEVVPVRTGTAFTLVLAALAMVSVKSGPAMRRIEARGKTAHRR
jgi:C4-dicarboxylate-specific signal transduction histidine kinase